jgi:hypothetical protein
LGAVAALCGLAVAVVLGGLGGVRALRADSSVPSRHLPPTWHAVETANFRILNFGSQVADEGTQRACEAVRKQLAARWYCELAAWSPKCEVVLHPTRDAYLRAVGAGGRNTVGSALVDRHDGVIRSRRIDICAVKAGWVESALAHEMTHVVLADRFTGPVPRWVDEGVAILADPRDKQGRHREDLVRALAHREAFRVCELMTLADYPAPNRWGTFYGQSASLVQFLVAQHGEQTFMDFVEASLADGYDGASRRVYRCDLAELERHWRAHCRGESQTLTQEQSLSATNRHATVAQTVSLPKP